MLKLERDLLVLDFETTGTDVMKDRIVEIGVTVLHPDGTVNPRGWSRRFNPGIPIPPEATEIHHITDDDVKDCPPFGPFAPKLYERMKGKDLAGYNLGRFDLCLLDEEMRRVGLRLDLAGVRVIDAKAIYFAKDPRTLGDAVRRFCKREPAEGAHGAGVDTSETVDVLMGQLLEFGDLSAMSLDELAVYCRRTEQPPVDIAGNLYRDAEGFLCFGFGKNKDKRVVENVNYCKWMAEKGNFPGSTMDAVEGELSAKR